MNLHRNSLFWRCSSRPPWLHAVSAGGGDYNLTKSWLGESGVNQVSSADYGTPYALGEDAAGLDCKARITIWPQATSAATPAAPSVPSGF